MNPLNKNQIIQGNALTELQKLESESIDCCITSPPYWALRDYKVDGQLGLEPTFQEYVTKLVTIFDEVKRVLKKTGTCWVVIGDTYQSTAPNTRNTTPTNTGNKMAKDNYRYKSGLPEKSLCMIPERFSIAMIDHGWILRNKIIWYKPNCMPSSAKDRFTVDWEYVYFFTKSQKYFFETQYEPLQSTEDTGWRKRNNGFGGHKKIGFWNRERTPYVENPLGRIKRCVWKISTKPFSGSHFAVFPSDLVKPMIKAGCPIEGLVLDPFFGAGTTGLVALQNARDFIGIELNPEYIKLTQSRLEPLLNQTRLTPFITK